MVALAIWTDSDIERLIKNAEENVISLEEMKKLSGGDPTPVPGDDGRFVLLIQPYYRVVFTHEEHPNGRIRHMSISTMGKIMPTPILEILVKELGFVNPLNKCKCFVEPPHGEECLEALNIMDPIDGNWEPHMIKDGDDGHNA